MNQMDQVKKKIDNLDKKKIIFQNGKTTQLNSQSTKYKKIKLSQKNNKNKLTRVNPSQHDKPATWIIRMGQPNRKQMGKITKPNFQQSKCRMMKLEKKINKQK